MTTNPSARAKAVTDPDPFPSGYATNGAALLPLPAAGRGSGGGVDAPTNPTSRYSVRPRSELTRIGKRAATTPAAGSRLPPSRRNTGAMNSWNVKIADVGNPGRTAT